MAKAYAALGGFGLGMTAASVLPKLGPVRAIERIVNSRSLRRQARQLAVRQATRADATAEIQAAVGLVAQLAEASGPELLEGMRCSGLLATR